MRKLFAAAVILSISLAACAQKKEQREEEKRDMSAEHMRNQGVDSTAASGHTAAPTASDSLKKNN